MERGQAWRDEPDGGTGSDATGNRTTGSQGGDHGGNPLNRASYSGRAAFAYSGKSASIIPLHKAKPPDASRRTGTPAADLERRLLLLR